MKQLLEIIRQINELSGVALDALQKASGGQSPEGEQQQQRQGPPERGGQQPPEAPPGQ